MVEVDEVIALAHLLAVGTANRFPVDREAVVDDRDPLELLTFPAVHLHEVGHAAGLHGVLADLVAVDAGADRTTDGGNTSVLRVIARRDASAFGGEPAERGAERGTDRRTGRIAHRGQDHVL